MSTAERSTPPLEPKPRLVDADELPAIPDHVVKGFLVTDPVLARKLKARWERTPLATRDEVWDGVHVTSPAADLEHQFFGQELWLVFRQLLSQRGGGIAYNVLNVSDRVRGWTENFRELDVAVYLKPNPAKNCGTHMCGGPDFAAEILSDNVVARQKLDFYAQVNTRELLFLDRDSWAIELYRLIGGKLVMVGISTLDKPETLTSDVLALTIRLVPGVTRPILELCRLEDGLCWRI